MRLRKVFYLAGGLTTGMAIAAACSFPEPTLVPDGAEGGGPDTGGPDGGGDVNIDGGQTADIFVPDSPPPIDATSEKPAIDAAGCTCDCDKDRFSEAGSPACGEAGAGDCDDLDPRAFPDAGFRTDLPTLDTKGDWDCDGKVVRQFNVGIDCSSYSGVATGCASVEGFIDDPPCGAESTYVTCKIVTVTSCVQDMVFTRTQGCK